jgi:hypothetical protein
MKVGELISYLNENFELDDDIIGIGKTFRNREDFERMYKWDKPPYTDDEWLDVCNVVNQTLSKDIVKRIKQATAKMSAQQTIEQGEGLSDLKEFIEHHNLSTLKGSFFRSKKK